MIELNADTHNESPPTLDRFLDDHRIALFHIGVWLSVFLYVVACAVPAIDFGNGSAVGVVCLIAFPYVLFYPFWYANPAYFIGVALTLCGRHRGAAACAKYAATLATGFQVCTLCAEGLHLELYGSWLWMLSMWLFCACTLWRRAELSRTITPDGPTRSIRPPSFPSSRSGR